MRNPIINVIKICGIGNWTIFHAGFRFLPLFSYGIAVLGNPMSPSMSVLASALNFTHLGASLFMTNSRHNRDLARAKINGKFHLSFCGLIFEQNSRKIKQSACILMI